MTGVQTCALPIYSGRSLQPAEAIFLNAVGDDPEQEMPGEVRGRLAAEYRPPSRPQILEAEGAQMRDLGLYRAVLEGHGGQALRRAFRAFFAFRPGALLGLAPPPPRADRAACFCFVPPTMR